MSLDREIEDLLAVDPSPEFVARVRQHIAGQPAPRAWWYSWRVATAGAGLAVVILAALFWPAGPLAPVAPVAPTSERAPAPIAPTSESAPAPIAPIRASAIAPSRARAIGPSEVQVPSTEADALRLLVTRVAQGRLPDMTESLALLDATGPKWIEVAPVEIDPIPTGEGE